jgi:hypothetical protein
MAVKKNRIAAAFGETGTETPSYAARANCGDASGAGCA